MKSPRRDKDIEHPNLQYSYQTPERGTVHATCGAGLKQLLEPSRHLEFGTFPRRQPVGGG
jgi:hypothetical protein